MLYKYLFLVSNESAAIFHNSSAIRLSRAADVPTYEVYEFCYRPSAKNYGYFKILKWSTAEVFTLYSCIVWKCILCMYLDSKYDIYKVNNQWMIHCSTLKNNYGTRICHTFTLIDHVIKRVVFFDCLLSLKVLLLSNSFLKEMPDWGKKL